MDAVRVRFDHDVSAAVVRQAARDALDAWHAPQIVDDTLVVVTELVANVSRHTADGGELTLTLQPDAILVEVADTSPETPQLRPRDIHRAGGRGLLLVAAVTRRWGSRAVSLAGRAGKVVWAELALRPPGMSAATGRGVG
jgi:anti-sigma regulatory factor (Ser/Thr protein kinase)